MNILSTEMMKDTLEEIHGAVQNQPDLEEEEVTSLFENRGFFEELGYIGVPTDVRTEKHIAGGDRPDYFCKDKYGNIIFVVEFKKPSRREDLGSHEDQLWDQYVVPLKADYGVLTDGEEIIVYERGDRNRAKNRFRRPLDDKWYLLRTYLATVRVFLAEKGVQLGSTVM